MIRAVLDTNVVVSSFLTASGMPSRIVRAWKSGAFEACLSQPLLDELAGVLCRPEILRATRVSADETAEFLDLIGKTAIFAPEPLAVPPVVADDPADDPADDVVVATALVCEADIVVSGDHHLLALREYEGIPIVNPRQFLETLGPPE
ncbi:putative toxin-antitoxin system toxin component, PIN family [Candidatus Sumerlaeota bacterium]|nr:putative toxin-antitoxin system toxin component, PIN family [Candidatus Sumerlaeota bacterium]